MMNIKDSGIRIAAQPGADASDSDIAFINQLGVKDVILSVKGENANYDSYVDLKKRFNDAGIDIYALGNDAIHC